MDIKISRCRSFKTYNSNRYKILGGFSDQKKSKDDTRFSFIVSTFTVYISRNFFQTLSNLYLSFLLTCRKLSVQNPIIFRKYNSKHRQVGSKISTGYLPSIFTHPLNPPPSHPLTCLIFSVYTYLN